MADVRTPPRKLVDLHPAWGGGVFDGVARRGISLQFACPCLAESCPWGTISVWFANALDGLPTLVGGPRTRWQRTGDTFETLTLSPSIHCVGHWHGWLKDGVLVSC